MEMLGSLKHMDAVISETLRLYSPALAIARIASRDYTFNSDGKQIIFKKGVAIRIPTYGLHRNPAYFPEPDSFKPERFFPENRTHHPYAYLPFGGGPRNCVARRLALMEAKLALMHAVYNFKFSPTSRTKVN
jgi:cytochrome P450